MLKVAWRYLQPKKKPQIFFELELEFVMRHQPIVDAKISSEVLTKKNQFSF
jgi:hypothetical protein